MTPPVAVGSEATAYYVLASKINGADGTVFFQPSSEVPGVDPPILVVALVLATLAARLGKGSPGARRSAA